MSNSEHQTKAAKYWKAKLRLVYGILIIWALVSFGCGIVFREKLDAALSIGKAPFGFWMAQQGSIICFILLLVTYAVLMNRLDAKYGFDKDDETEEGDV